MGKQKRMITIYLNQVDQDRLEKVSNTYGISNSEIMRRGLSLIEKYPNEDFPPPASTAPGPTPPAVKPVAAPRPSHKPAQKPAPSSPPKLPPLPQYPQPPYPEEDENEPNFNR